MSTTAPALSDVQLLELELLADEFSDAPNFLAAHLVPFVRWCRAENVTLPAVIATGFDVVPSGAAAALVIACVAAAGEPGTQPDPLTRAVRKLVDALDHPAPAR